MNLPTPLDIKIIVKECIPDGIIIPVNQHLVPIHHEHTPVYAILCNAATKELIALEISQDTIH